MKMEDIIVNGGNYNWEFKFVSGGFCMQPPTVLDESSILSTIFPSLQRETSVRLAHKGVFPLKTDKGYIYLADKSGKIVGSSVSDEFTISYIQQQPKNNRNLRRVERAELKLLNLLK